MRNDIRRSAGCLYFIFNYSDSRSVVIDLGSGTVRNQILVILAFSIGMSLWGCEVESLSGRVNQTTQVPLPVDGGTGTWLCSENTDCPFGMICRNNLCVLDVVMPHDDGCVEDADCPPGYRCSPLTGQCIPEAQYPNWPSVPTSTCSDGEIRSCGSKIGVCEYGTETCVTGNWNGECAGEIGPDVERCDGLDNDCDSASDEDFALGLSCERGVGVCLQRGSTICASTGTTTDCSVSGLNPAGRDELCGNGLDDNCDGQTDEGYTLNTPCTVGVGICERNGVTICDQTGLATTCSAVAGSPGPAELCGNNADDNCDGAIDEGFANLGTSCTVGTGLCERSGVFVCSVDQLSTRCSVTAGTAAPNELCGNNVDDNCDGTVDEGFATVGDSCTAGVGACEESGVVECSVSLISTQCSVSGGTPAANELCGNNADDNCDGTVDEGFANLGMSCNVGQGTCTATGAFQCTTNLLALACDTVPGSPNVQGELCGNRLDDDCDGQIDEGYPLLGSTCSAGMGICLQNGMNVCATDLLSTICDATAGSANGLGELCGNMADDDCDGQTDEGYSVGAPCAVGDGICRRTGMEICAPSATQTMCNITAGTPNAQGELCGNGFDDDCDGQVDEGFALNVPCSVGIGACERSGVTICSTDGLSAVCSASPGTAASNELCGNNVDDNCNGAVDEGFSTVGDQCSAGVGACEQSGVIVCSPNQLATQCSVSGAIAGANELCGNNVDDNCNGAVDEGFATVGNTCAAGVGACEETGTVICTANQLSTQCSVSGGTAAPAELCGNNVDDNCNGAVDEGYSLNQACSVGMGICENSGVTVCSTDQLSVVCNASAGTPGVSELCGNTLDDNCNGQVDEGYPSVGNSCTSGIGACEESGMVVCSTNQLSVVCSVSGGMAAANELCGNNVDDNCNGQVDEGFALNLGCTEGMGICERSGLTVCSTDRLSAICSASAGTPAANELCGNNVDDNCNGQIDEGFATVGNSCSDGIGACERNGAIICSANQLGTECSVTAGTAGPNELCGNNVDDNCNGATDEGYSDVGNACMEGVGACERSGNVICAANQLSTQCSVSAGTAGPLELCGNNLDDNCNGQTDEGFVSLGSSCLVGAAPCQATGMLVCSSNLTTMDCELPPSGTEICNGLDDDNDTCVDEDFDVGTACDVGTGVCFQSGVKQCVATGTTTECSVSPLPPGPNELCGNMLDDDCDTQTDEGFSDLGDPCDIGVGICNQSGLKICSSNLLSTTCGALANPPNPLGELCGNLSDDDCDGQTDEGFPNLGDTCTAGDGICLRTGTFLCATDRLTTQCSAVPGSSNSQGELCGNTLDDDCDGQTDEGYNLNVACAVGIGACETTGVTVCSGDRLSAVCGASPGAPGANELCGNNSDDNCNGAVDEGFSSVGTTCTEGVGACEETGVFECTTNLLGTQCSVSGGMPGANELCGNNSDDNCNGQTDEGYVLNVACTVGVGACEASGVTICSGNLLATECSVSAGMPGANELCGNNSDDNCNGAVDEGFSSVGTTCTEGVGACEETGVFECTTNLLGTQCSVSGGMPGANELCGNNSDDNCNGQTDEGFPDLGNACTDGLGICQRGGAMVCAGNLLSTVCDAVAGPSNAQGELCGNNLDDDCNGQTDEGFANLNTSCTVGVGACERTGVYICSGDQLGTVCSVSAGTPATAELCGNNIDDNCNGSVDEGFGTVGDSCSAGLGVCEETGNIICSVDRLSTLCSVIGGTPGANELCGNGFDDNCNGQTDEGFNVGANCTEGIGICEQSGATICSTDRLSTVCNAVAGSANPLGELCGNNADDDCDGQTDEGYPTMGNVCTSGMGQCEGSGFIVCSTDRLSAVCDAVAGTANPLGELCGNNADDDCNGQTDEGYNVGVACSDGAGICQQNGNFVCTANLLATECNVTAGPPNAQGELCGNSQDDDCDGMTDEGYPTVGNGCSNGQGTCERRGAVICSTDGLSVVCDAVAASPNALGELCGNNADDDCDGQTDEGYPDLGNSCTAGQGVCEQNGSYVCSSNLTATVCSATAGTPGANELCGNNTDDDCDGQTDEGFPNFGLGCSDGVGICEQRGRYRCTSNLLGTECNAVAGPPNSLGELCGNNADDDCDGQTDEGFPDLGFACTLGQGACEANGRFVCSVSGLTTDCNATPGNPVQELCDDLDNDCNGAIDNGCDDDGDDYCDANLSLLGQPAVCPNTLNPALLDCDDTDLGINPGAMEICNDGVDQDCDGDPNNGCAPCDPAIDADFDGSNECDDCNDTNGAVFPGATEDCDGIDNDCDLAIDEDFDGDNDTYTTCGTLPAGGLDPAYIDCDDGNPARHPFACELCALGSTPNTVACGATNDRGNGVDEDCDGYLDETCSPCDITDPDGDGVSECDGDCAPNNPNVAPGLPEICDGLDTDCNTTTIENCVVGDPCNWGAIPPSDVCAPGLLCVESLNASGAGSGSYSCTSLCNFSSTGMGIGDGCAANQICDSQLTPTANLHGCAVSQSIGTGAVGSACSTNSDCRSNWCIVDNRQSGSTMRYCADYCGSNDYCGGGTTCQVWGSDTGICLTPLSTQDRGVGVNCFDTTLRCEGGPRTCIQWRPASYMCSQACCTNTNCPSGYFCAAWGNASFSPTSGIDTVPVCWPEMSIGAHNRQAGASCANNNECASEFCDRTLNVCVDLCCNNSTCPSGLTCNQGIITRPDGGQTYARICTNISPMAPLEPLP